MRVSVRRLTGSAALLHRPSLPVIHKLLLPLHWGGGQTHALPLRSTPPDPSSAPQGPSTNHTPASHLPAHQPSLTRGRHDPQFLRMCASGSPPSWCRRWPRSRSPLARGFDCGPAWDKKGHVAPTCPEVSTAQLITPTTAIRLGNSQNASRSFLPSLFPHTYSYLALLQSVILNECSRRSHIFTNPHLVACQSPQLC